MQDELNDAPAQTDTWLKNMHASAAAVDEFDLSQLRELASAEANLNRAELEKLYNDSYSITGELRYHLLWRLSQLERKCFLLDRAVSETPADLEEMERARKHVAELTLQAVQLRQEARLLLNATRRDTATSRRRSSGLSGRRYPHFAGV